MRRRTRVILFTIAAVCLTLCIGFLNASTLTHGDLSDTFGADAFVFGAIGILLGIAGTFPG